jgi:hypothetical protein
MSLTISMDQRRSMTRLVAGALLCVPAATAATAQGVVTRSGSTGVHAQSFSFGDSADVSRAQLVLVPVAVQQRLTDRLALDAYTAYARGSVSGGGSTLTLSGPVDSWARLRWAASDWAVVAVGLSMPTGVERHTAEQAVVSNTLSNDLLGFREGNWGTGISSTMGVTAVRMVGSSRVTGGVSYRTAAAWVPRADATTRFQPGQEIRVRAGADREIGAGRMEGGVTWQRLSADRMAGKNLFQSGVRVRGDMSYSLNGTTLYAANLWRDRGEATVPVVNALDGGFLRDTILPVGWQNLAMVGVATRLTVKNALVQPTLDYKYRSREETAGRGWLLTGGATVSVLTGGLELFPTVRASRGSLVAVRDITTSRPFWGAEVSVMVRRSTRR